MKFSKEENKRNKAIVQNYNARIKRLSKTMNPKNLPDKVKISTLKSQYTNKNDFNSHLRLIDSFNKKSLNEFVKLADTAKVSKYKYQMAQLNAKTALNKLDSAIKDSIKVDEQQGRNFYSERTRQLMAQYHDISAGMGKDTDYSRFLQGMKTSARWVERRYETNETFYKNFLSMLTEVGGYGYNNADPSVAEDIEAMIMELTPEELLELYNREEVMHDIVEDYHKYLDTDGSDITGNDEERSYAKLKNLRDSLPALIEKYKYINKPDNPRMGKNMDLSAPKSSTWSWSDKPLKRKPLLATRVSQLRNRMKNNQQ